MYLVVIVVAFLTEYPEIRGVAILGGVVQVRGRENDNDILMSPLVVRRRELRVRLSGFIIDHFIGTIIDPPSEFIRYIIPELGVKVPLLVSVSDGVVMYPATFATVPRSVMYEIRGDLFPVFRIPRSVLFLNWHCRLLFLRPLVKWYLELCGFILEKIQIQFGTESLVTFL